MTVKIYYQDDLSVGENWTYAGQTSYNGLFSMGDGISLVCGVNKTKMYRYKVDVYENITNASVKYGESNRIDVLPDNTTTNMGIVGYVIKGDDNTPFAGANVSLMYVGTSALSWYDGFYFMYVPKGLTSYYFQAEGYIGGVKYSGLRSLLSFGFQSGNWVNITVMPEVVGYANNSYGGHTYNSLGNPAQATIQCCDSTICHTISSNTSGYFNITGLVSGNYNCHATSSFSPALIPDSNNPLFMVGNLAFDYYFTGISSSLLIVNVRNASNYNLSNSTVEIHTCPYLGLYNSMSEAYINKPQSCSRILPPSLTNINGRVTFNVLTSSTSVIVVAKKSGYDEGMQEVILADSNTTTLYLQRQELNREIRVNLIDRNYGYGINNSIVRIKAWTGTCLVGTWLCTKDHVVLDTTKPTTNGWANVTYPADYITFVEISAIKTGYISLAAHEHSRRDFWIYSTQPIPFYEYMIPEPVSGVDTLNLSGYVFRSDGGSIYPVYSPVDLDCDNIPSNYVDHTSPICNSSVGMLTSCWYLFQDIPRSLDCRVSSSSSGLYIDDSVSVYMNETKNNINLTLTTHVGYSFRITVANGDWFNDQTANPLLEGVLITAVMQGENASCTGYDGGFATTDKDGVAVISNLCFGKYTFHAMKPMYTNYDWNSSTKQKTTSERIIMQSYGTFPITGKTVTRTYDSAGNIIEIPTKSHVMVYSKLGSLISNFQTASDGTYSIRLYSGLYDVYAIRDSDGMKSTNTEPIAISLFAVAVPTLYFPPEIPVASSSYYSSSSSSRASSMLSSSYGTTTMYPINDTDASIFLGQGIDSPDKLVSWLYTFLPRMLIIALILLFVSSFGKAFQ
jgi:hypothetical protein